MFLIHVWRCGTTYLLALAFFLSSVTTALADWKDDIGYTDLAAELGAALPTGAGVNVSMAEAPGAGNYLPNTTTANFAGKTVTDLTGTSTGFSGHATGVANTFFGNTTSIAPGVTTITAYDANDWLENALGYATSTAPDPHPYAVQNHSWIANFPVADDAVAIDLAERVDYLVNRDNVLIIGGANNGAAAAVPDLLAHSYNAINVGRTDGKHSHGNTALFGPGRPRPDIVAPSGTTSGATPMVSSAAAMLYEYADGTNATNNQVMRAVLMAGATKDEFADWDRTVTRPIDEVYGAGELNVYNSYKILEGGEYDGTIVTPTSPVGLFGYDFATSSNLANIQYEFEVGPGQMLSQLSVFLQWNVDVVDANGSPTIFQPSIDPLLGGGLANLDLFLYDSSNSIVDQSISNVDNFEHIYFKGLTSGTYSLQVSSDRAVNYGLAWRAVAVPEPSTWVLLGIAFGVIVWRTNRRVHPLRKAVVAA